MRYKLIRPSSLAGLSAPFVPEQEPAVCEADTIGSLVACAKATPDFDVKGRYRIYDNEQRKLATAATHEGFWRELGWAE